MDKVLLTSHEFEPNLNQDTVLTEPESVLDICLACLIGASFLPHLRKPLRINIPVFDNRLDIQILDSVQFVICSILQILITGFHYTLATSTFCLPPF